MLKYAALATAVLLPLAAPPATSSASPSSSALAMTSRASGSATTAVSSTAAVTPAATTYADWPGYHGGGLKSGYAPTVKHPTTVPKLTLSLPLDGAVYAQPVVVDHGIKIVATENNTVYRIANNAVVWKRHIGPAVPGSALPCGDIDPTGITGTPDYDPATNTVVVVSIVSSPIRHVASGLNPVTGAVKWQRNVDVPASVTGIDPQAMQERGALLVVGRRVYIPYGGLAGDCSNYRGSVVGVDLDHPTTAALWHYTVPTSREAGIWSAPGAVAAPGGGILVAVGNGATASTGTYDSSDSVLKLANQQIQDSFSPSVWRQDNANDLDLGSQGPLVVGNWIFIAGKNGMAYLLRRGKLGGIGGQASQISLCKSFGGAAVAGDLVYVPCTDGIRALRVNDNGTMTPLWHAPSNINGTPTLAGGLVWVLDPAAGVLHALRPNNGQNVYSLSVGATNRFAAPAAYGNGVLVGTLAGVKAFGW